MVAVRSRNRSPSRTVAHCRDAQNSRAPADIGTIARADRAGSTSNRSIRTRQARIRRLALTGQIVGVLAADAPQPSRRTGSGRCPRSDTLMVSVIFSGCAARSRGLARASSPCGLGSDRPPASGVVSGPGWAAARHGLGVGHGVITQERSAASSVSVEAPSRMDASRYVLYRVECGPKPRDRAEADEAATRWPAGRGCRSGRLARAEHAAGRPPRRARHPEGLSTSRNPQEGASLGVIVLVSLIGRAFVGI